MYLLSGMVQPDHARSQLRSQLEAHDLPVSMLTSMGLPATMHCSPPQVACSADE